MLISTSTLSKNCGSKNTKKLSRNHSLCFGLPSDFHISFVFFPPRESSLAWLGLWESSKGTKSCMRGVTRRSFSAGSQLQSPSFVLLCVAAMVVLGFISILSARSLPNKSAAKFRSMEGAKRQLKALTWNMAAINNNHIRRSLSNTRRGCYL